MEPASALRFAHLSGPVFSRRLGRSLGVDLLPYKTCSLDCIYCECGPTTHLTTRRETYVAVEEVLAELDAYLDREPELDFVTFSGSGEPTLHAGLGLLIAHLKRRNPRYKVAVLTNGTLFSRAEVRRDVLLADLLIPSLDGATPGSFAAINRPAAELAVDEIIEGLVALRREYRGTLVLEVFIVPGVNDAAPEVEALRGAAGRIQPDAIQLNRLDRPGIDRSVAPASDELLATLRSILAPLPVFVVPRRQPGAARRVDQAEVEQAILACVADGSHDTTTLALLLGLHEGLVAKHVGQLVADGRLLRSTPVRAQPSGTPIRVVLRRTIPPG